MSSRSWLVVTMSALLCGCGLSETAETTIRKNFSAASVHKLSLRSLNSHIEIVGAAGDQIRVEADVRVSGPQAKRILKEGPIEFEIENGVLNISESSLGRTGTVIPWLVKRDNAEIDYRIELPPTVALAITNVSGSIEIDGMTGPSDIQSVNGAIDVTSANAPLTARTVNGPIDATFTDSFPGAKLRTVNGPVEVSVPAHSNFVANVSQVNGGFESNIPVVLNRNGSQSGSTGPAGTGGKELEVTTINGDITLTRSDPAEPPDPPEVPEPAEPAPDAPSAPTAPPQT